MSKQDKPSIEDSGVGLDCGTMNFVSARKVGKIVRTSRVRDAFIDLPMEHRKMLKISNMSFVEMKGKLLVIGDEALQTANLLNREARRPMSGGVISPGEVDAQQVMGVMIKQILGSPKSESEKCCFSVPAPAVDVPGSDMTYHQAILKKILTELGYSASATNEAMAVVFSECPAESFSGLGISFGSGMTNVCLSFNAMSALEFSVARGGDWVDFNAARALSTTAAKMCSLKESGVDISAKTDDQAVEALAVYLTSLIDYVIDSVITQFSRVRKEILIPKPVPIIISGGTSLATGFVKRFEDRFKARSSDFPIQISEIRPAKDPMVAVATGLLVLSQAED